MTLLEARKNLDSIVFFHTELYFSSSRTICSSCGLGKSQLKSLDFASSARSRGSRHRSDSQPSRSPSFALEKCYVQPPFFPSFSLHARHPLTGMVTCGTWALSGSERGTVSIFASVRPDMYPGGYRLTWSHSSCVINVEGEVDCLIGAGRSILSMESGCRVTQGCPIIAF